MRNINTKRNQIVAGVIALALIVALFIAALMHVERTTPQHMEQHGTNDYYDQVMAEHLKNR